MNILVTGGTGYIGGRIANYIEEKKPGVNIFLTTRDISQKLPSWTKKFTILQMDLLNEGSINNCLRDRNIDVIIHLAASNEIESIDNPRLALDVNTLGTYKLLNLAHANNINKFVYFSTFHVYGEVSAPIVTEETPTRPFHPYAITHRAAEDFVNYFRHYHDMKTLIFRLSNGYGYPLDKEINRWTLVFNDLCKQVATTCKIVLKSSGRQYRDFISLHNVARAVYHFLFVIPDKWGDGLYNLGGNCSMSILEVAQRIANVYRLKYKRESMIKTRPEHDSSNIAKPIKYSIEKLLKTKFVLRGEMDLEIEKTIDLCKKFYA